MGNFNVDELPDLNEKNSKPKAFNVDELPDLKKKDEPNLKSGSNGSSSSNTTSKSESGFSNGKSTTSQVKPVNNMPIEQINNIGNIFQKPTEKKQEIPIPFDAKKTQPIAGTKLPVPEKVDYAVNKEGKDIQGVEWGAFKEYEVSQRALSEVDKKLAGTNTQTIHINSIGAFTSPVDNKQFEQELSKRKEQLTQERNPLKIKADAVLEVTNNQVEKIIDVAKNKYGLDHFSYTNKDGEKVADPTKVEAWAKSIAKKAGLPEDSYAERLLYNQMKAQVDFKPVAEKIDQEVKTIYKSKYGKSFDDLIGDDQKKYFSQFKEGKEIEERFKLQEKSVLEQTIVPRDEQTKQLGELYKQSAESLNAEFESMHSQQSQKAEIAKSLYEKGTLPYETANQQINEAIRQQKALQSDFAKKLEDVTTEYLTNNSYINAKYNKQAKRMIDELAKSADREYRKVAEKYAQGYKIPDSLKKEYESVYKQAYSKVTKSEDERLYEKDKGKLLSFTSSLYNQHFMHGLGGAIKSFSTALGLRSGEILGDNIQSRRSFSNQEIKDASDFVNPVKFIGSAGETIGGMLPMIAGQTTISALTGGMSIPAQMALQGIYGVTTEALQSAGANKDQIFAQTGSVTEANKAFNKTMTGYLALFPLATIDGLPFIEKATLGIKNWAARAGAKSIVETAGETLQETMQNKVDKIATDIKEEDLKSMFDVSKKDFYQSGLNVAPTTLIMGGAPTIFHQGIKEYRTAMGKAYATKNMLADVSGSAREQFIHELVTNRGSDFTKAYATALFNNGEISGIELDRLHDNIKTAEKINQNSEALGLTKPQARVYAAMQFDLENSKRDAFKMDYTDSAVKSAHEQIINDKQTRLNDFLATKKGDYAVVTNADLSQQVLTLDEFDKLAENPEFIKALAGGDVQAFIETDKKGKESKILSDSINAKIKEQNTAKPSTSQQTPTELTVGLSDKEGNKITRISEDGNDIFVQDKDGNIKTYTKDEADKIFGTELLPNPIVNQNQIKDGKEQKAEGQENVLTGTDQKVEPQVQEDKTNTPAPLESLTAEQKKEVAKDVEAKALKQKAIDGTLDEYLLGLYNEKIQKENENKGTPVEPTDTGKKQNDGKGVQQPQQDDKSIQQGSGTGQNMPDQEEISVGKQKEEQVKPIRQLGTGANVYFETPKYRVNDSRNGKVYLNIGNELDEVPLRTVEFDNANEAVFVAKKLEEYRPDGLTNEYNVDAIIETLKSEYNNQGTPNEVNQPVQQDASTADKQGNKEAVQQGADATGQGNAEGKSAVLDIEKVQNKLNNNEPLNGEEIIIAEQNKLTPQNLDNNIKLAEDENEQQLAESKLTKEDNIEQEPNVKAIESKANSNNEVELNEAVKKADELINASTDVVNVPISEISVNTEEYQGRKKQFSERSANKVHKFFDKNKFDPIVVYKHPNGKTYVLSGHSRFEGIKRRGETTIPARVFEGTPQEAKDFALKSNKLGTLQTDIENAAYYREQLNNGKSYNAVLEEAKANEQQGSAKKIVSMAHLNPNGKTMKSLEALEGTEGDSNTNLVNIATKIGDIRAKNPHITDAHENELFEYMTQDKDNIPTDKELADQNSQINRSINSVRFDNKEPLNLQKFTNKSDARLAWETEKKDLESQITELKKEVNPSKKTGWTGLKEKAIASIAKGNTKEQLDQAERDFENDVNGIKSNYQKLLEKKRAELTAVSNKLAKHLLSEKNLIEGEKNQGSLFSAGTKPNIKTISKKAFDKLIERLKKAFPNVKVFQDENTLKSKLKEFGVDIAQFLALWHGSPHDFDKFSTDKIGTGEGAQAFGWGLYFTDLESIARSYANSLSANKFEIAKESLRASVLSDVEDIIGKPLTAMQKAFIKNLVRFDYNTQRVWLNKPNTVELFVAATVANTGYNFGDGYREWETFKDVLPKIQDYDQTFEKDRNLYKADIHKGRTPEQYNWLEWYKPVKKELFDKIAHQLEIEDKTRKRGERIGTFDEFTAKWKNPEQIYSGYKNFTNGEVYERLAIPFGSRESASLLLLRSGIDGIKYPAKSIARGATSDNARGFNYVVFDENAIEITEKVKFLRTKDGTIYGAKFPDGSIYINPNELNANTPIHEFGHIWEQAFGARFRAGVEILKQSAKGRALIEQVRNNPFYKNMTQEQIEREALVVAIGNKGEQLFGASNYEKLKQWISDLFKAIKEKLGIKQKLTADETLENFTKGVVGELLGGKVLNDEIGKSAQKDKSGVRYMTLPDGRKVSVRDMGIDVVNGFYSNTEYALAQVKDNKMSGNKWKQQLLSRGAKSDEMQWTGLDQFLSDNNNQSVTKAEIEQFMKDNRISVVEVVKGIDKDAQEEIARFIKREFERNRYELTSGMDGEIEIYSDGEFVEDIEGELPPELYKLAQEYYDLKDIDGTLPSGATKYHEYQLEGEKSNYKYKEVLVVLPQKKTEKPYEQWLKENFYGEDRKEARDLYAQQISEKSPNFKSSHFDEPNILVHLRVNTRTDVDGNKVLFLEELQSDWAQTGKKEGFADAEKQKELDRLEAERQSLWNEVNEKYKGQIVPPLLQEKINEVVKKQQKVFEALQTPTAPFVTETPSWVKLGLKVALKEAVKQGADKIAWTTGEQQNERYDLSKQVDKIEWANRISNNDVVVTIKPTKGDARSILKYVVKRDTGIVSETLLGTDYVGKKLDEITGKDIADKILSEKYGELKGEGLKVGGKGMIGFYGSPTDGKLGIVGQVAESLFGQKVGETKVDTGEKGKFVDELRQKENRIEVIASRQSEIEDELKTGNGNGNELANEYNSIQDEKQKLIQEVSDIKRRTSEILRTDVRGKLYSTQPSITITPELKAQVQEGLPLFKFDSNTINDDVREMKAAGLSEDRIREVLSLSGNTQEEIDKALYDTQNLDSDKQRVADRFVKGDSGFEQAKQMVIDNGYDKGEYDSKQVFDDIDNLIEKSGTDNIEKLLDLPLSEPHRVVLQHRIFEHFGKQSTDETLSEQERKDAFEKSARYLLDLSRQRTEAGRGNAILHQIYLDSDIYFTLPMAQKKMDALGTILSDSEMAEMKEMAQEIERLRKENKDLQELAQKEQDDKIVDDIKNNLLVDELILDSNTKDEVEVKNAKQRLGRNFQKIAEKFGAIKMLDATEKTDFFQILHEMTKDLMTISKIGAKKALKSVIKSVKNQHPDIDNSLLDEAKQYVLAQENEETDIEDSKGNKISKGDLLELIEEGADTMNKLIIAIRDKFHGGDTSVTDKQIRDAITGYGNSMKKDKTTVEKKLSEIKAIMLLQSKLEDALNNIHPKKTGVIREKDTIDVIRLRRQLSEAMKKLKGDMSESEIAGLNERKLTYLGNRIKEVQDVIDGLTTKVDEKAPFEYSQAVKDKQKELDRLMKDQRVLLHYTKEKLTNLVAKYQEKIDKKIYSKEPILSKLIITDNEHEILKNKLKYKKKQLENARDKFRNNNSDYLLNQAQKSIEKQINRIDELIKGISKRKTSEQIKAEKLRKQGIIDKNTNETAVKRLKANQTLLENKKEEWERMLIKKQLEAEMANKSALQRIAGKLIGGIVSLSRTSTLGLIDVGWIGVQGGYFLRTKPKTFAKALNDAYKNGDLDEKSFRDWIKNLKEVPMYEIMLKVGLRIPNQSLKQEIFEQEYRQSKFTDFLDKIPGANLVNKNGRLSVKFLAHLRMETFVDLYNKLNDEQKQDTKTLEKLADFVNVHTGAGGIIGENKSGSLNKWWGVLTSARNTSSMLQQTYLGMIYQGAKNFDSKRGMLDQPILVQQVIHDIFNQSVLFGTLFLAKYIAKYIDKDDDDDEWEIEMNPFSTDYMRLKAYGNKYFDMGGTTSLNVATLRLATMIMNIIGADIDNYKTKDGSGQIGGSKWNDPTGSDILINATVSRLVPFLSFIKNPLQAKKKDGNYYLFGKEYTPNQFRLKILTDMFKPINLDVVISDLSNKQQNIISTILNFLIGALGVGVQPVSEKNVGKTSNLKGYENPYKNNYKSNYKNDYKSGY